MDRTYQEGVAALREKKKEWQIERWSRAVTAVMQPLYQSIEGKKELRWLIQRTQGAIKDEDNDDSNNRFREKKLFLDFNQKILHRQTDSNSYDQITLGSYVTK